MDQLPTLPRRVAWFAPWTWRKRWFVVAALPAILVAYVLLLGPIIWLVEVNRLRGAAYAYWGYKPLRTIRGQLGPPADWLIDGYAKLWSRDVWEFMLIMDEVRAVRDQIANPD